MHTWERWDCGSVHTYERWADWRQEKHYWCHEMICVFFMIAKHVNWMVFTTEYVSSWIPLKLLMNYLLLCWCCVWCISAYSSVIVPLCVCGSQLCSLVSSWETISEHLILHCTVLFVCLRGGCILSSSFEWRAMGTIALWLRYKMWARQTGTASFSSCQNHILI